jgi:hypothetical protein
VPTAEPQQIPASYVDTGKPCAVTALTLNTRPPRRTFAVGERPVYLLSPHFCQDGGGRLIKADVPGAFGGF